MSESKHTPGKWEVFHLSDGGINNLVGIPDRALAMAVVSESVGEAEANARLIAAAPEMLALLKEWEKAFDDAIDTTGIVRRTGELIAKAEGET